MHTERTTMQLPDLLIFKEDKTFAVLLLLLRLLLLSSLTLTTAVINLYSHNEWKMWADDRR